VRQWGRVRVVWRVRQGRGALLALALASLILSGPVPGAQAARTEPAQAAVSVFPIPGSRVASPKTQIAFRGVAAGSLGPIQVDGSKSGPHSGRLEPDSDGAGASFLPSQPFTAGETVTVVTSLNVLGGRSGSFHFQVATPAGPVPFRNSLRVRMAAGGIWRTVSRPDLAPPAIRIERGFGAGSGDIFLTPQYGPIQNGPEIVDPRGQLVWFNPVPKGDLAANLQVERYHGAPVLTWWEGYSSAGIGIGQDEILDTSYRVLAVVRAANGLSADLHEFEITPAGTALITAYYPVIWNASAVHGSRRELVFDSVVQEVDIPTGLVLFQWDSLDHVPMSDSYSAVPRPPQPYDYFHVNSVQLDGDGTLLVSARNTWTVYKIDHQTGAIIWRLGGKHSSFRMLGGSGFAFQHDVRSHAARDKFVTLFDDGAGLPAVHKQSRALELRLDLTHHTARVFKQWNHSPGLLSLFEGNVEQLPGLDEFVGWGQNPYFSEFDQRGRMVLDGRFVTDTASYRAYRFPWSATPATPPAVAATAQGGVLTLHVSWNGATGVSSWQVLEGPSLGTVRVVKTVRKTSFETVIEVPKAPYVEVVPLDSAGHALKPASAPDGGS